MLLIPWQLLRKLKTYESQDRSGAEDDDPDGTDQSQLISYPTGFNAFLSVALDEM